MARIWTIGHSTHSLDEFLSLLDGAGIRRIVDVRSVPRSRRVPQFNKEALTEDLPAAGVEYIHMVELGGWRKPAGDSVNAGWRNAGFRGYADYAGTAAFTEALARLIGLAREKPTAVMCAESLPFKCHRTIISDYLGINGVEVLHIYPDGKQKPHVLTDFAMVGEGLITYPEAQGKLGI